MLRSVLAALTDVAAVAVLGYVTFRIVDAVTPCADPSSCFALTPAVVGGVLIAVALYFGLSLRLIGRTPGQRLWEK